MSVTLYQLTRFRRRHRDLILVTVAETHGSTPRELGAFMLVAADATLATIGGGQLEHMCVQRARRMLAQGADVDSLDVPLGPQIGQCCGGRVVMSLRRVGRAEIAEVEAKAKREESLRPHVYVFGAGHVGRALAHTLALLPVRTIIVDTRPSEMLYLPRSVEARAVPMPEAVVRSAPAGSSFVILTHDHALDFLIVREALARPDAPYVGMIGSRTKRATFTNWFVREGGDAAALEPLVCPIGGSGIGDKRPQVIAALAAAEIMVHIGSREASATALEAAAKADAGVRP